MLYLSNFNLHDFLIVFPFALHSNRMFMSIYIQNNYVKHTLQTIWTLSSNYHEAGLVFKHVGLHVTKLKKRLVISTDRVAKLKKRCYLVNEDLFNLIIIFTWFWNGNSWTTRLWIRFPSLFERSKFPTQFGSLVKMLVVIFLIICNL